MANINIRQLILLLVISLLFSSNLYAKGINKSADNETLNEYCNALFDDQPGTRLSGRVWSDKTVYTNENQSVEVDNHTIESNEDFVEVYSALGSNSTIGEIRNTPIDLVLTVDCSNSMGKAVNDPELENELKHKPILMEETVKALNQLIEYVMAENPENRISLVIYQNFPKVIFPLGRYSKLDNQDYVSISIDPELEDIYIPFKVTFCAKNNNQIIEEEVNTFEDEGDLTNFQLAFFEGLNQFVQESSDQRKINRPKFINLTDGIPTKFSGDKWNCPDNYENQKGLSNSDSRVALILQTLFTVSYMKAAVNNNYGYPLQFIMLQIDPEEKMSNSAETILNGVINKNDYLNSKQTLDNEILKEVQTQYQQWLEGNDLIFTLNTQLNIPSFESISNNLHVSKEDMLNNLSYVDLLEWVPSTGQSQVFQDLIQSFKQNDFHPVNNIETDNEDDHYVTYKEPIGQYMVVKPLKMILFGKEYNFIKTSETNENPKTETFKLNINESIKVANNSYANPVESDLKNIQFILTTLENKQELTIKIPENCLPLVNSKVGYSQNYENNEDRTIEEISDNRNSSDSLPIRFIYGVSLDPSIKTDDGKVDLNKISQEYKDAHLKNNQIEFFTTEYNNALIQKTNQSYGNAYTSFLPSQENIYYKSQEEKPVYKDPNLEIALTNLSEVSDEENYYIQKSYFGFQKNQPTIINQIDSIDGLLLNNNLKETRGNLNNEIVTIQPGQNYIGDLHEFSEVKSENITSTADLAYYPVIDEETNPNGMINTYLGNNGKMALPVSFDINISITKYQAIGENSLTKDRLTVSASDIITYQLTISNLSDSTIHDILITDIVPNGLRIVPNSISNNGTYIEGVLTWTVDLDPKEELNLTYKATVENTQITEIKNLFTIEYEENKKIITKESNIVEADLNLPNISLTKYQALNNLSKTINKQRVNSGDFVTYSFEVKNNGKGNATSVSVSDTIPEELEVNIGSISDGGIFNNNVITWNFPLIKAGETKSFSFGVIIPANSIRNHWENTAYVAHDSEPNPKNSNTVIIDKNELDLSIEKLQSNISSSNSEPTKNILNVNPGNTITYYLNVTNNSQNEVNSILITDNIPEDLTIINGSISNNGINNQNRINWTIPLLSPGATIQLSFQVKIPENNQNKMWNNTFELSLEDNPNIKLTSNTVTIQETTQKETKTNVTTTSNTDNTKTKTSTVSSVSTNPKTGKTSNFNALIWLIGLFSVLILTGQTYRSFK